MNKKNHSIEPQLVEDPSKFKIGCVKWCEMIKGDGIINNVKKYETKHCFETQINYIPSAVLMLLLVKKI